MTATQLITAALAASRVTRLITTDAITAPLRDTLPGPKDGTAHIRLITTNARFSVPNPAYIPTCVYCSSVYAAAFTAALATLAARSRIPRFLLVTLALSEVAILIQTHTNANANATYHTPGGWER